MKKFLLLCLMLVSFLLSAANFYVDCCKMPFPGDWRVFNKAFLAAQKKGSVASGEYTIPESGRYYIWLENFSFGGNWRKISIAINGRNAGKAGDEKSSTLERYPAILWSRLPVVMKLDAGKVEIRVKAESANSRVGKILFTTDAKFIPNKHKELSENFAAELVSDSKSDFESVVDFKVSLNKSMVSYQLDEPIVFTIDPQCGGKTVGKGFISYTLSADYGKIERKTVKCAGKPVVIVTSMSRPGFVRLQAELLDSKMRPVVTLDENGKARRPVFNGGAGVAIDRIPSLPEPSDFDAFWARHKARLNDVPLKPEITSRGSVQDGKYNCFSVSVPCPGPSYKGEAPRPLTGIYSMPTGAAPKSLKARLVLPGYGSRGGEKKQMRGKPGYIYMAINAHGMEIGRDKKYYDDFSASRSHYAFFDGADVENCYFNGMVLRMLRALEFLRSLPEWNGRDLEVFGASQGGLQALWAAGLDPQVTLCIARIPWACNMGETTLGLMGRDHAKLRYDKGREYYDPVNFAKRIKCPVNISRAGMGDYHCPPSGIARVYYNLNCPKEITWVQDSDHSEKFSPENDKVRYINDKIEE